MSRNKTVEPLKVLRERRNKKAYQKDVAELERRMEEKNRSYAEHHESWLSNSFFNKLEQYHNLIHLRASEASESERLGQVKEMITKRINDKLSFFASLRRSEMDDGKRQEKQQLATEKQNLEQIGVEDRNNLEQKLEKELKKELLENLTSAHQKNFAEKSSHLFLFAILQAIKSKRSEMIFTLRDIVNEFARNNPRIFPQDFSVNKEICLDSCDEKHRGFTKFIMEGNPYGNADIEDLGFEESKPQFREPALYNYIFDAIKMQFEELFKNPQAHKKEIENLYQASTYLVSRALDEDHKISSRVTKIAGFCHFIFDKILQTENGEKIFMDGFIALLLIERNQGRTGQASSAEDATQIQKEIIGQIFHDWHGAMKAGFWMRDKYQDFADVLPAEEEAECLGINEAMTLVSRALKDKTIEWRDILPQHISLNVRGKNKFYTVDKQRIDINMLKELQFINNIEAKLAKNPPLIKRIAGLSDDFGIGILGAIIDSVDQSNARMILGDHRDFNGRNFLLLEKIKLGHVKCTKYLLHKSFDLGLIERDLDLLKNAITLNKNRSEIEDLVATKEGLEKTKRNAIGFFRKEEEKEGQTRQDKMTENALLEDINRQLIDVNRTLNNPFIEIIKAAENSKNPAAIKEIIGSIFEGNSVFIDDGRKASEVEDDFGEFVSAPASVSAALDENPPTSTLKDDLWQNPEESRQISHEISLKSEKEEELDLIDFSDDEKDEEASAATKLEGSLAKYLEAGRKIDDLLKRQQEKEDQRKREEIGKMAREAFEKARIEKALDEIAKREENENAKTAGKSSPQNVAEVDFVDERDLKLARRLEKLKEPITEKPEPKATKPSKSKLASSGEKIALPN